MPVCSLLTLGQSCSNFLVASGFSLAQLNPCRSDYEYYVAGLIQQGKLNGAQSGWGKLFVPPCKPEN